MKPLLRAAILLLVLSVATGIVLNALVHEVLADVVTETVFSTTVHGPQGGAVAVARHEDDGEMWLTVRGSFGPGEWAELEEPVLDAIRQLGHERAAEDGA